MVYMVLFLTSLAAAAAIAASLSAGRPLLTPTKEAADRTIYTSPCGTDYIASKAKTCTKHLLARA